MIVSDIQHMTYPHPQPRPTPRSSPMTLILLVVVLPICVGLGVWSLATSGPDLSPAEERFVTNQTSGLDDDEALRYGKASCDLLDSTGQAFTAQWLAGTDDFSQAGVVAANPDPISLYDARQIAAAAEQYLCP